MKQLTEKFDGKNESTIYNPDFKKVADKIFDKKETRVTPYSGIPTFLDAPYRPIDWKKPDLSDLDVAILGVPMDLVLLIAMVADLAVRCGNV